jgi:RNA-binding protein YhbY
MLQSAIQLGKNGVTENFIETLKTQFKRKDQIRISVLKSAGREREKVKEISDDILRELNDKGIHYTSRIIGFTIVVKKWRKARN